MEKIESALSINAWNLHNHVSFNLALLKKINFPKDGILNQISIKKSLLFTTKKLFKALGINTKI